MTGWIIGIGVIILLLILAIIAICVIFLGLKSEAKRNKISKGRFLLIIIFLIVSLAFTIGTIFMQDGINEAALLVSPIFLALTLVLLQDFFTLQNSKQIQEIHAALEPENSKIYKETLEQNRKLSEEISSLKKEIQELNCIITNKRIPENIIIENRNSLISFSPRFNKEK